MKLLPIKTKIKRNEKRSKGRKENNFKLICILFKNINYSPFQDPNIQKKKGQEKYLPPISTKKNTKNKKRGAVESKTCADKRLSMTMTEADVDADADNVIGCCIFPSLRVLMMDPIFVHIYIHIRKRKQQPPTG